MLIFHHISVLYVFSFKLFVSNCVAKRVMAAELNNRFFSNFTLWFHKISALWTRQKQDVMNVMKMNINLCLLTPKFFLWPMQLYRLKNLVFSIATIACFWMHLRNWHLVLLSRYKDGFGSQESFNLPEKREKGKKYCDWIVQLGIII